MARRERLLSISGSLTVYLLSICAELSPTSRERTIKNVTKSCLNYL